MEKNGRAEVHQGETNEALRAADMNCGGSKERSAGANPTARNPKKTNATANTPRGEGSGPARRGGSGAWWYEKR
jgi:hypothetical protein